MDLEAGVSLGQLLLALGVLMITGGITFGGLMQRVKTLEKEVASLSGFAVAIGKLETDIGHVKKGIEQITGSWLFREPPGYTAINPHDANPRRRT